MRNTIFDKKKSCNGSNILLGLNVVLTLLYHFLFLVQISCGFLESKYSMDFQLDKRQNYPDWKNTQCEGDIWLLHRHQFLISIWTSTFDSYGGHQHVIPTWTATSNSSVWTVIFDSDMDDNVCFLNRQQHLILKWTATWTETFDSDRGSNIFS